MRLVERHPRQVDLDISEERKGALHAYLLEEVEAALAARNPQEAVWRENLRLYEGIPKNIVRNIPVENAPNTEITLGAIAADAIYAQVIDLVFTVVPTLTVRAVHGRTSLQAAKALQAFINWGAANEWALRSAIEQSVLDDVQLGTGSLYIPFVEHQKKTKVKKITSRAPRILTHPIEDLILPGGAADDLQVARWVGLRWWYLFSELRDKAKAKKWDITGVIPVGAIGWTKSRREQLGRTSSSQQITELP